MLNVKALCAVALSGRCCVPGRRLAGSLQHTSMRKACSEALMSSALSNQIVSCPLPSGRGFLRFPQKPRVEYMFVFVLFFSWKLILQWIFVLLFLHFKSTFLFFFSSSSSSSSEHVWSVWRKLEIVSVGGTEQSRTSYWAGQSFCWSWICVKKKKKRSIKISMAKQHELRWEGGV